VSVGPLSGYLRGLNGNVTVTIVDGDGNIKYTCTRHNVISTYQLSSIGSALMNGAALPSARYIYIWSSTTGMGASATNATAFCTAGCMIISGYFGALSAFNASAGLNMGGAGTTGSFSWYLCATFSFTGLTAGLSSVGGAVLAVGNAATYSVATYCCSDAWNSWFAAATFTPVGIASTDKLTIVWAFCMCTSG
jgi:hypothetical protein